MTQPSALAGFDQGTSDGLGETVTGNLPWKAGGNPRELLYRGGPIPHTRVVEEAPRQSRLVRIQYAAIAAMKNDMRSAMPAMVAIMVE